MAKSKRKNLTNKNQDHSPSSEPSTPTSPSLGHPNTPKKLDPDLKAYLMMMVEDIKKNFNNSLKEIKENTAKELKSFFMSSTSIMRYDFKSESCFSGVLVYPELAEVGVLGSDDGEWSWFLLVRFLRLPFDIW